MTGAEIYEILQGALMDLARGQGAGVDFMEPVVLMAKLRVRTTPEKDDLYCWQSTPLLRVRRERTGDGCWWNLLTPEGEPLQRLFQEQKQHKGENHG